MPALRSAVSTRGPTSLLASFRGRNSNPPITTNFVFRFMRRFLILMLGGGSLTRQQWGSGADQGQFSGVSGLVNETGRCPQDGQVGSYRTKSVIATPDYCCLVKERFSEC